MAAKTDRVHSQDSCKLCMSMRRTIGYFVVSELTYTRCDDCGLIVQDPLPTNSELKAIYRLYFRERRRCRGMECGYRDYDKERSVQSFRRYYLKWFKRHILSKGGRFLDFGCGLGNLVQVLLDEGFDAVGCEFSEEAIGALMERRIPFFRREDLVTVSTRFKYVSMIDVIEHLRDPLGDLQMLHDLMEEGGILFIETVNAEDIFVRYVYRGRWQGISPVHTYLFGKKTLARLLDRCGFEIIEAQTYKMCGSLWAWIITKVMYYALRAAYPVLSRCDSILGYSTTRLRNFVESEARSPSQFSLGDGLRVTARKV